MAIANRYFFTAPNGGETWNVGSLKTISWRGAEPANLWLPVDGGNSYQLQRSSVGGDALNATQIRVPHTPTKFAMIRISPADGDVLGVDASDSLFTIQRGTVYESQDQGAAWTAVGRITVSNASIRRRATELFVFLLTRTGEVAPERRLWPHVACRRRDHRERHERDSRVRTIPARRLGDGGGLRVVERHGMDAGRSHPAASRDVARGRHAARDRARGGGFAPSLLGALAVSESGAPAGRGSRALEDPDT